MSAARFLKSHHKRIGIPTPEFHFVLGSGLSSAFSQLQIGKEWEEKPSLKFSDLPELIQSSAPGHTGLFRFFYHHKSKKSATFQVGRLHGYEGLDPQAVVQPVIQSLLAGTKNFILTNAAGSLNKSFKVGSVMLIEDHVNLTGKNPLIGPVPKDLEGKALGPRFPDMSATYDKDLLKSLRKACTKKKLKVHKGVYLGLLGPSYETPAEVRLFSKWGLGSVGMSTVWEAIALKHAGARLGGLSFISNMGCGLDKKPLRHEDVEKIGKKISGQLVESLFLFLEKEFKV